MCTAICLSVELEFAEFCTISIPPEPILTTFVSDSTLPFKFVIRVLKSETVEESAFDTTLALFDMSICEPNVGSIWFAGTVPVNLLTGTV